MKLDRIAVALDFSEASRGALATARRLAEPGASLELIHVVDSALDHRGPTYGDPRVAERLFEDLIRGALAQLEVAAEELRIAHFQVTCVAVAGRPADAIVTAAEGANLLVMGSHGRGALGRLVLGSVAEEVARRSPVPVLVVRDGLAGSGAFERVVVAVDPSGPSRDAIRAASALATRSGARLEAVHSVCLPPVLPYADKGLLLKLEAVLSGHLSDAPTMVRNLIARTAPSASDVKIHVVQGPPADEIVRFATPRDLVVCGTHARSALGRLAFGSVAAKLLRHAPCPVLVVRPSDDESECEIGQSTAGVTAKGAVAS